MKTSNLETENMVKCFLCDLHLLNKIILLFPGGVIVKNKVGATSGQAAEVAYQWYFSKDARCFSDNVLLFKLSCKPL